MGDKEAIEELRAKQRSPMFERFDFDSVVGGVDKYPDGAWVRHEDVEAKIASGELMTKAEVEEMLSVALGVSKSSVWAELGSRIGVGTRVK